MHPLSLVVAGALALAASGATWTADHGNGTYSNPLFYDEFSDPDLNVYGDVMLLSLSTHRYLRVESGSGSLFADHPGPKPGRKDGPREAQFQIT